MYQSKLVHNVLQTTRLIALVICCIWTANPASAMQNQKVRVVDTIWGFDGRLVAGQFQPVSVLLDNLSEDAVEGELQLRSDNAMMQAGGGVLTESIYIGPRSRRWVQLYPYISQYSAVWRLTLRADGENLLSEELSQPRLALDNYSSTSKSEQMSYIAVILDRSQGTQNRNPTSVKHFPEEIFPPYVTATVGLRVLYLDHVPDWELPRQESFLSWVRAGGQLHLLLDVNSERPRFEGALSVLNEPGTVFNVGSGAVVRHEFQRDGLTDELVAQHVRPVSLLANPDDQVNIQANGWNDNIDGISIDNEILLGLRELTRPDHNWFVIFLLSVVYIGLIFPGSWLLSRVRTIHYLFTYGAIVAAALVFSGLFLFIGQRGYGESTVQHCMSVARHLDGKQWKTSQWATFFVTSGDRYLIHSKDEQAMFALGGMDDSVNARIHCGNLAELSVRIPPFSSQAVMSQRVLSLDDWTPVVTEAEVGQSGIVKLSMNVEGSIPKGEGVQYLLIHEQLVYRAVLSEKNGQLELQSKESLGTLTSYCKDDRNNFVGGRGFTIFGFRPEGTEAEKRQAFFDTTLRQMLQKSLLDEGVAQIKDYAVQPGRVRLCVFAPTEDRQKLPFEAPSNLDGRTLFLRDVVLSGQ